MAWRPSSALQRPVQRRTRQVGHKPHSLPALRDSPRCLYLSLSLCVFTHPLSLYRTTLILLRFKKDKQQRHAHPLTHSPPSLLPPLDSTLSHHSARRGRPLQGIRPPPAQGRRFQCVQRLVHSNAITHRPASLALFCRFFSQPLTAVQMLPGDLSDMAALPTLVQRFKVAMVRAPGGLVPQLALLAAARRCSPLTPTAHTATDPTRTPSPSPSPSPAHTRSRRGWTRATRLS